MNRAAILSRLTAILAADPALHGANDDPSGPWPQAHGPLVREYATDDLAVTSLWLGGPRGSRATEQAFGSGLTIWEDNWTVDAWGSIGPTDPVTAAELAERLIAAVRTIVMGNRVLTLEGQDPIPTLMAVSVGNCDGPDRYPAPDGGGVVATVRCEILVMERG